MKAHLTKTQPSPIPAPSFLRFPQFAGTFCVLLAALVSPAARLDAAAQTPSAVPAQNKAAAPNPAGDASRKEKIAQLAHELHDKGWIAYSARTEAGDWDLFLMRPDGSDRHRVTHTPEFNETGPRFSPDGTRMLYYRQPRAEGVDNGNYGTFDLVIAKADGTQPEVFGNNYPWASWSPDGRQIACLTPKGIKIVEVATRKVVREFPRKTIAIQMVWSPDGKLFLGTANGLGPYWNIGVLDPISGELHAVTETDRYNCTSDWCSDSRHIVYARGIVGGQSGLAELWVASADGKERHRIYAEAGRHVYGACASPDGKYALFTRSVEDLGAVVGTEMAIIPWPDADSATSFDGSHPPVRVDLGPGFEPHWTRFDVLSAARGKQP